MTKLYLFDIEGTTTDINFVHKVLFPYSAKNLTEYIQKHQKESGVVKAMEDVKATVLKEDGKTIDVNGVIETLHSWIKADRKHGALKEIQGLTWDKGYSENHFRGHVYPDVLPFFKKIKATGASIGIYSSGSIHAQKLIFGFSEAGDLTPYISFYFDTGVGAKREKTSYENIVKETKLAASEITFYSDIPEELVAAKAAGLNTVHVVREGTKPSEFKMIKSFEEA